MKKILKALGIATLAAAVIPCKVEKDELTGEKTYQSLLSKLRVRSGEDGEGTAINLDLLGGVLPSALGHSEAEDYADDDQEGRPACETCDVCDTCETPDACATCEVCETCDAPEDVPEDVPETSGEPAEETTKDDTLDL